MFPRAPQKHPPCRRLEDQRFFKQIREAAKEHAPTPIYIERIIHEDWCDAIVRAKYCNCVPTLVIRPLKPTDRLIE